MAKFLGTESTLSGCVAGLANSLGCIKDLVAAAVDYVVYHPGAISSKAILKRVTSANLFRKGFAAAQWFGSFAAAIAFQNIGGTGVSLNDQPTRPSQDRSRRPLNGSCLSHTDTTWIIDNVCQDALDAPPTSGAGNGTSNSAGGADGTIVNDTDSAGHILFRLANGSSESVPHAIYRDPKVAFDVVLPGGKEDAATYQCLARRMPLRDWLPSSKLTDYGQMESASPATCNSNSPSRILVGNETNWILRQSNGQAHLLDGNSVLHPIKSPTAYICLAQSHYVLDARSDAEIGPFNAGSDVTDC